MLIEFNKLVVNISVSVGSYKILKKLNTLLSEKDLNIAPNPKYMDVENPNQVNGHHKNILLL